LGMRLKTMADQVDSVIGNNKQLDL
jgi:hypothetical protein